jgi:hypothetical protein
LARANGLEFPAPDLKVTRVLTEPFDYSNRL